MELTKIVTKNYIIVLPGQGFQGKEMAILLNKLDRENVPYTISTINEKDLQGLKGKLEKKNFLAIGSLGNRVEQLRENLKLEIPIILDNEFSIIYEEKLKQQKYSEKSNHYKSPKIAKQSFYRRTNL